MEYRVNYAGLMRCCIDTIKNHIDQTVEYQDQQQFDCIYEHKANKAIILDDKTFRFNSESL